nr:hypothetical protein [Tanacetum cinerariifolium]
RHFKSGTKSNSIFAIPDHGSTSPVGRKSNAIFALPGHGSTSPVGRKSNAIFALPGHGSTSSVGRKSNAIFALSGHESTSPVGCKSNAIFALPGHGSTSSVGRKSNAIFALSGHESTSPVGCKSNAIFALPGHGSTSFVGRKSNAIFTLPGYGSTSSIGLYYTGSAFIIINPSHYPLVKNEREWYLANATVTPTIENVFFLRGLYRLGGVWLESANVSATANGEVVELDLSKKEEYSRNGNTQRMRDLMKSSQIWIIILQGLVCTVFNFICSSISYSDLEFSSAAIAINSANSEKISSLRRVPLMEWRILLPSSRRASKSSSKITSITLILKHVSSFDSVKKGRPKMRQTLQSSSISRLTKSTRKVNLPTSTSIFLAIPIGYWNDLSANLTIILVGLSVLRDSFAYKEYGIRLMLAPRSAKALQEKVSLKLHRIRNFQGYDHGNFEAFPSYEAKHRLEIRFHVEKAWISSRSQLKRAGGKNRLMKVVDSFIFGISVFKHIANFEEFMDVFMRIDFGSAIKLVSFDESQVVTFNSKFFCNFRNGNSGTESQSDSTVGSPHGFIIHWIIISKNIKKVTKVIDAENGRVDNSQVLRWIVSLIEWNSSVSSMKSLI